MTTLQLNKEEANILIAAAIRGMRGTDPLGATPADEEKLINKLINMGKGLK